MNRDNMRRLDEYRFSQAGPLENDLIDELAEGGMDRQEFIKRRDGARPVGRRHRLGARRLRHAARVRRADRPRRRAAGSALGIIPPPIGSSIPTPTSIRVV